MDANKSNYPTLCSISLMSEKSFLFLYKTRSLKKMNLHYRQAAHALTRQTQLQPVFRQAGGSLCFWGLWLSIPPTISTVLQDFKRSLCSPNPPVPTLSGEPSTWPRVSYSSQVCLRSVALAWYTRILGAVLAFCFSNSCYFTFKVGHHWKNNQFHEMVN